MAPSLRKRLTRREIPSITAPAPPSTRPLRPPNVKAATQITTATRTRTIHGVSFEMLSNKEEVRKGPHAVTNVSSTNARRQTRPQTKKGQQSEPADTKPTPDNPDVPRGLTIRKVKDADETSPLEITNVDIDDLAVDLSFLDTDESPSQIASSRFIEHTSNDNPSKSSAPRPTAQSLPSYRKAHTAQSSKEEASTISVILPRPAPNTPRGYVWVSPIGTSSRPSEPWGWMKVWTCCQCAELDPSGRRRPAETIVEQKVCSRLACGHERCGERCRVVRDAKFNSPRI